MKHTWKAAAAGALAVLFVSPHAQAQLAVAKVVAACGTTSPTPHAGSSYPLTMDITGTLCTVAGSGPGGGGTSSNFGAAFPTAGTAAGFEYLSSPPTLTTGQMVAGQTDINGNLKVSPATSALWAIYAQGAATSGQLAQLMMGAVTTAAPTYTTAQSSPLSLDAAGNLRVNVVTGGGTGGTSSSFGSAFPATGTAAGLEYLTTPPTLTNGQMVAAQTDINGNLKVNGGVSQATNSVPINISTATTTQLVALSSGKVIQVTGWDVLAGGTGNITLEYGTGSNCATGTTVLTGPYSLTAQTGLAPGSGLGGIIFIPASNALCAVTSAAVQMSGRVSYLQF